jgi:3-methyladenine DNA glycosylase AlkD
MANPLAQIRAELQRNGSEEARLGSRRYFKEPVNPYGVSTALVTRIAAAGFEALRDRDKREILGLCDQLWASGYLEESFIACHWAYALRDRYEEADLDRFERWLSVYVSNWASCDTLCNHAIGSLVEMCPHLAKRLKAWARSENRWMRRGAAVSLIVPAKKGRFLDQSIEIAGILLLDKDDLVQKGYGWLLKAASQAHQARVFDYVMSNRSRMPRTALRYAIEKMPADLRARAMKRS